MSKVLAVLMATAFAATTTCALAQTTAPAPAKPASPATPATPAAPAKDAPKAEPTAQQQKMKDCNVKAGDKKGDERQKFMSECLKAEPKLTAQQQKMKDCNAKAGDKKGDDRQKFMSECLKAKS